MIRHQIHVVSVVLLVVLSLGAVAASAPVAAAQDDTNEVDQELIDEINEGVDATNARMEETLHPQLELAEPPEPMEPVEQGPPEEVYNHTKDEVDRLSDALLLTVVREVNLNAEEMGQGQVIDPADVNSPDDARAEADSFVDDYGHITDRAHEAQDGLYSVADSVEEMQARFEEPLQQLESQAFSEDDLTTVSGTVTDEDDNPIEGVDVSPESGPGDAETDADGSYEIEILASGNTLEFTHSDYETVEETVDGGGGESQTLDVSMEESGGDDDESGGLLDSALSTGGLALSGLAIVSVIGVGAFGALREDEGSDTLRAVAGTVGLMVATGVAIGGAGYLTINWALDAYPEEQLLGQFGPLIGLMLVFLVAPALAVLLGLTRKAGGSGRGALVKGLFTCMAGAVLLVLLAMALIGEAQAGESSVETIDAVSVAGIVGTVSAIAYTVARIINEKVSATEPAAAVSTAD